MGKTFNVTASKVGNNDTSVNFNGTMTQYSDNKLDHCDVSGVSVDMDLFQASVSVQIYATCIDPEWPALLHTKTTYSVDQSSLLDNSLWFNDIIVPTSGDDDSIGSSINTLAGDLWRRMRSIYLPAEILAIRRGLRVTNQKNCALEVADRKGCFESPVQYSNQSLGFFLYRNLSIATEESDPIIWDVATNNFLQAVFAAARYDFGVNMTNNLFSNQSAKTATISSDDNPAVDNATALVSSLSGAQTFLQQTEFAASKVGKIRTSYMCLVQKIKPTANFVIQVLGLAFAIFGAVFAVAAMVFQKLFGKHIGGPVPVVTTGDVNVTNIQVNPDNGGGGADGCHHDGEKDINPDSPYGTRTNTPAPGYGVLGKTNDVLYTPLNDKSWGSEDGSVTPSPTTTKGRLSQLGSFASLSKFKDLKENGSLSKLVETASARASPSLAKMAQGQSPFDAAGLAEAASARASPSLQKMGQAESPFSSAALTGAGALAAAGAAGAAGFAAAPSVEKMVHGQSPLDSTNAASGGALAPPAQNMAQLQVPSNGGPVQNMAQAPVSAESTAPSALPQGVTERAAVPSTVDAAPGTAAPVQNIAPSHAPFVIPNIASSAGIPSQPKVEQESSLKPAALGAAGVAAVGAAGAAGVAAAPSIQRMVHGEAPSDSTNAPDAPAPALEKEA